MDQTYNSCDNSIGPSVMKACDPRMVDLDFDLRDPHYEEKNNKQEKSNEKQLKISIMCAGR